MKRFLSTAFLCAGLMLTGLFSQTPFRVIPLDAASQDTSGCYAGAYTLGPLIGQSNDIELDTIFLCHGDSLLIDHHGDAIFADPNPATPPGICYAFYKCPPTVTGTVDAFLADPCLWPGSSNGFFVTGGPASGDHWLFNSGLLNNSALFGNGNPVLIHYAPITITDYSNGMLEPGCVDVGINNAFAAVYLRRISENNPTNGVSTVSTNFGDDCRSKFRLFGGLPEWDLNETYTIDISLAGNPAVKGLPHNSPAQWKHSTDVIFSVPAPGWYDVTVRDGKSCSSSFQVDMTGCDASDNLFLSLPSVIAKPGATVCLPMKVKNCRFLGASFSLSWDTAVLQFTGTKKVHSLLKSYQIDLLTNHISSGNLGITMFDGLFIGAVVPDGETMMEFCFEAIGLTGTSSPVRINASVAPVTNDSPLGDQGAVSVQDGVVVVKQIVADPPVKHGKARLSPNPVSGGSPVFLEWESPDSEDLTISLSDPAGRILSVTRTRVFPGPNRIELSTAGLPAGCYFVNYRDRSGRFVQPEVLVVWE
jgi:hypothetical protein